MAGRMTLGVDFGGSASKATLIDEKGKVLAVAEREYKSWSEHPGWMEQSADDYYPAFVSNVREIIQKSGIHPEDIEGLAVDAATHMAVLTDENDRPLRKMIHWSDKRSGAEASWLNEEYGKLLKKYSYNSVSAAWTLPQLLWLKKYEPGVLKSAKRIYFAKDYLRHQITGDFCTDYIEAMGSLLADDVSGTWVPELCELVGVNIGMLPSIKAPTDVAGWVSKKTAEDTGLSTKTQVYVGTTDTALEVYASGAIKPGCATVKLATAGRICPVTEKPVPSHQFFNYRHVVPGLWYPGTGTSTCAISYKWYRDIFGEFEVNVARTVKKDAYEVLNAAAERVPAGSDNLFFHPYLLGEMTPYYDNQLRASFTGATMGHTKGHFTRAVMEGVAYSLKDSLEEIYRQQLYVDEFRIIGGGAKGRLWCQIVADILGQSVVKTMNNDSSLGAAMLAGVACGMFMDYEDSVNKCVKISGKVDPIPENVKIYQEGFSLYRDIQKALAPIYHRMG